MNVTKESIIIVGVIAVLIIVFSIVAAPPSVITNMEKNSGAPTGAPNGAPQSQAGQVAASDEMVGTGAEAVAGTKITVHYTGTFEDGTKFDSSVDRGTPFQFILGAGQVIPGWDRGVQGMKVGGKRRLVIPPDLAYGPNGVKGQDGKYVIPPNATLHFEVELLKVEPAPEVR